MAAHLPSASSPQASTPRRRFLGQRGSVAIQTAAVLAVLLGVVALGTEVGLVLMKHRQLQSAADGAALAGASALNVPADPVLEGRSVSADHGFANGVNGTVVTINHPPLSGSHTGDTNFVEAIVSQPQALSLAALFGSSSMTPGARAVATRNGAGSGGFCILSLDPTAPNAVTISNNVLMNNASCGLAANSSASDPKVGESIHLHNNATVSGPIQTVGGIQRDNGATTPNPSVVSGGSSTDDPYGAVALPTPTGSCTTASTVNGGTANLQPGCYSGWNFSNKATINLAPGVYWVNNQMFFGNGVNVNGTGVTIIVNNNYAISFGTKATLNISAPTSGNLSGLALIGQRTLSTSIQQKFTNNAVLKITGAVYFPSQMIWFLNNTDTQASQCIQVIGRIMEFDNNVTFNYNCQGTGIRPIGSKGSMLVE